MALPVLRLHSSLTRVPSMTCSFVDENGIQCRNRFKSEISPAYCTSHRNNRHPDSGWANLKGTECRMINILRSLNWTEPALRELLEREREVRVDQLADATEGMRLDDEPPAPGTPPTQLLLEDGDDDL